MIISKTILIIKLINIIVILSGIFLLIFIFKKLPAETSLKLAKNLYALIYTFSIVLLLIEYFKFINVSTIVSFILINLYMDLNVIISVIIIYNIIKNNVKCKNH